MGFSRQEYWSGLPFPTLGDLPDPGTEPASPALAERVFITLPLVNPGVLAISRLNILLVVALGLFKYHT